MVILLHIDKKLPHDIEKRTLVWGVISAKTSFEIWDTEITFGWSIMEAIASFEWSTSIFKCKCNRLNGELLYSNGRSYLNGQHSRSNLASFPD